MSEGTIVVDRVTDKVGRIVEKLVDQPVYLVDFENGEYRPLRCWVHEDDLVNPWATH